MKTVKDLDTQLERGPVTIWTLEKKFTITKKHCFSFIITDMNGEETPYINLSALVVQLFFMLTDEIHANNS